MNVAKIGSLEVSAQGFGAMGLSHVYGQADEAESIRTLHRAIDLGVTFFDTATGYGNGHNEDLLGRAIAGRRDELVIASKFTHGQGGEGRKVSAREAVEASLRRLNVDRIDLYYLHRVDPEVPVTESVGQLAQLRDEGKIGGVGLSEASASQLRAAHGETPITALQSEYSLWTRDVEAEILPLTRELGIGFVAYSPLGRGFLAGAGPVEDNDRRRIHPRFQDEAVAANARRRVTIEGVAERLGVTPAQVSLAWVLSKGVVPIPGTRHIRHLEDNWAAGTISLDDETVAELEAAFPRGATVGDRYPAEQMAFVPAAEPALS
ncbi:aryl-alcohol dehydrogenase-like predicted oxidoreductase [Novosphingobium chloroacetimidivorans]|uniref:Aryl-alcohol dehydrogenase-like predicted oxidoreductase n=1 Tax=Novosphingobium chloroacetimidivorans TaxID=1428314 RepID=A0A7W7K7N3_9SPHN|nr:aldo/keto reductase [Novosphingobium chloroacetimidivorans]MBB4857725.1 aryl-alcohol dehydrogenase-like predicted oxidoreductase [Novosphingobium chloroacetimidivorans]